jgi:hypothetical protein
MMIYWTMVLLFFLAAFAGGETYALMTGKVTLSRYVWRASKAFPPLPLIFGVVVGFVSCHFFWGGIVCFASP